MTFHKTLAVLALLLAGDIAMALEEPDYDVVTRTESYEVRRYAPYIVAEVDVGGSQGSAGNSAFRILAGYIFGKNEGEQKMKMTAPVESQERARGAKMSMTAPVTSVGNRDGYTYAFVMESKYTLDTLPKPDDPRIRLVQKEPRTLVAYRYSGRWTEANYEKHLARMTDALDADGVKTRGEPILARYNSPFTPWFMRRNEILLEVLD